MFGPIDLLQHQGAGVHAAPLGRPGAGRVIHRIARFRQHQAQGPAQRALGQALLQVVLEEQLVVDLPRQRGERRLWLQLPAYRVGRAGCVDQAEGIDAVVLRAGEAVTGFVTGRPLTKRCAFRVCGEERLQLGRVGFAGGLDRCAGQHLFVEPLGVADGKHRRVVHAGAPDLAVIGGQLNCQAADRYAGVRGERVGPADGETANDRHPWLAECACRGQAGCLAAGLEVTTDAKPLGVVLAVAGVVPGLGFEGVDDALRGQLRLAQPASGIREAGTCGQHHGADGGQAQGLGRAVQR